jgi:hypothetical protein
VTVTSETTNSLSHPSQTLPRNQKRVFTLVLLAFIVSVNIPVIFNLTVSRAFAIDVTAILTSGAAILASGITTITYYFRKRGRGGYFWSSIGLTFWFAAEVIWVYNRQIVGNDLPYPSVADAAWIIGYGFFALHLYRIMRNLGKSYPIEKSLVVLVSFAVSLSLAYILNLTFGVADILGFRDDTLSPIVSLSYPLLDGILLVPSIVILWSLRKGDPTAFNWLLLSLAFILLTIGDIGFGYSFGLAPDMAENYEWILAIFYNVGYVCIAASVLYSLMLDRFFNRTHFTEDILSKP